MHVMLFGGTLFFMERKLKKINLKKTAAILLLLIAAIAPSVRTVCAEDDFGSSYYVKKYYMTVNVNKDHTYRINERITADLATDMDQVDIYLPTGKFRINDMDTRGSEYYLNDDNYNRVLSLKSPKDITAGEHTYNISYEIEEYADKNKNADFFSLDLLPTNWAAPVEHAKIKVNLPHDFEWDDLQFYAGQFGTSDTDKKIKYSTKKNDNQVILTGNNLPNNFGITIKADLPDGYWEDPLDNNWADNLALMITGGITLLIILMWLIGGRDPKFKYTEEKQPVKSLLPADVGYILNGKLRIREMIAMLLYLAENGNMRISRYEPKKYRFFRLKQPQSEERFVRNAFDAMFENVYENRAIEMEAFIPRLQTVMVNMEINIKSGYSSSDMFACTMLSRVLRIFSILLFSCAVGAVSLLTDIYQYIEISYSYAASVTMLTLITLVISCGIYDRRLEFKTATYRTLMTISAVMYASVITAVTTRLYEATQRLHFPAAIFFVAAVAMLFIILMRSRAPGNAKFASQLLSLRRFIRRATSRDVEKLQNEDPNYYYRVMPYAYLFAELPKWSRTFMWLRIKPPEWFTNDITGHAVPQGQNEYSVTKVAEELDAFARTLESEYDRTFGKSIF